MIVSRGALFAAVALAAAACTPTPYPEEGSASFELYRARCAQCHVLYRPHVLTAKMWEAILVRMDGERKRARLPPLTDDERAVILEYLQRNAQDAPPAAAPAAAEPATRPAVD